MRKTPKELLEEVMAEVRKKEEMELEFQERIRQIEEKKSRGKKQRVLVKEPEIIGYLGKEEPKKKKDFYGVVSDTIVWDMEGTNVSEAKEESKDNFSEKDEKSKEMSASEKAQNESILKKTNKNSKFKSKRDILEEE